MIDSNFDFNDIKLIVGLGNPGKKYTHTRHNTGFIFTDLFKSLLEQDLKLQKRKSKEHLSYNFPEIDLKLLQPLEYMNKSGATLQKYLKYDDLDLESLLVVHDDLDIKLGAYKLQKKSPKKHNGINSIDEKIGKDYYKLRIGIENRGNKPIPGDKYVLEKFSKKEFEILLETMNNAINELTN